jgi:protein disulfide-isomerase A6
VLSISLFNHLDILTNQFIDCKNLAPTWETLAHDFAPESHVVIAKVDAEAPNSKGVTQENGVKSYPTIKFFPAGETEAVSYEGARSEADFIKFLNMRTGTHRAVGGGLDATGGTSELMDAIVDKIIAGTETLESGYEEAKKLATELTDSYADYYVKVLSKAKVNKDYVDMESTRLGKLLGKGGLAQEKQDDLVSRSNILRKFKEIYAAAMKKDEL